MKISLAKALKLKNRFAEKLSDVSNTIFTYNAVIEGQDRPADINALMIKREKLVDALINLKTAISKANEPVQKTIYLLAELKGDVTFLKGLDTKSGKQVDRSAWNDENKIYKKECVLDFETVQGLLERAQSDVDANQDILDKHNHTVEIEIEDEVINLLNK